MIIFFIKLIVLILLSVFILILFGEKVEESFQINLISKKVDISQFREDFFVGLGIFTAIESFIFIIILMIYLIKNRQK